LRKYPGPKLWAASSLPWGFAFHHGYYHDIILALHRKYGRIIRIGPNQLSYDIPEAWDDIYSRSKHHAENPKPKWYLDPARNEVVGAKEKDHIRMRGLLAKGFTGSAMLAQEPLIKQNVDLLFRRFGENIQSGDNVLDMFEWFSYCTFDIIGDLTFGETFGCLKNSMMHPWLATVFANVKLAHTLVLCKRIPFFFFYLPVVETYKLWRDSGKFEVTIQEVISKHLGKEVEDESKMDFLGIMKMKKKTQVRFSFPSVTRSNLPTDIALSVHASRRNPRERGLYNTCRKRDYVYCHGRCRAHDLHSPCCIQTHPHRTSFDVCQ
jgi:hypothetical protein